MSEIVIFRNNIWDFPDLLFWNILISEWAREARPRKNAAISGNIISDSSFEPKSSKINTISDSEIVLCFENTISDSEIVVSCFENTISD